MVNKSNTFAFSNIYKKIVNLKNFFFFKIRKQYETSAFKLE